MYVYTCIRTLKQRGHNIERQIDLEECGSPSRRKMPVGEGGRRRRTVEKSDSGRWRRVTPDDSSADSEREREDEGQSDSERRTVEDEEDAGWWRRGTARIDLENGTLICVLH